MIVNAVVNDYETCRRSLYVLDETDFEAFVKNRENTDDLLSAVQTHDLFKGRLRWCDLDIKHFHIMLTNMLKIVGGMSIDVQADKSSAPVKRLVFFMCGLITLLHEKTGSRIELFRINRVSDTDVVYDYSAALEIAIEHPQKPVGFKVVVDNEED